MTGFFKPEAVQMLVDMSIFGNWSSLWIAFFVMLFVANLVAEFFVCFPYRPWRQESTIREKARWKILAGQGVIAVVQLIVSPFTLIPFVLLWTAFDIVTYQVDKDLECKDHANNGRFNRPQGPSLRRKIVDALHRPVTWIKDFWAGEKRILKIDFIAIYVTLFATIITRIFDGDLPSTGTKTLFAFWFISMIVCVPVILRQTHIDNNRFIRDIRERR